MSGIQSQTVAKAPADAKFGAIFQGDDGIPAGQQAEALHPLQRDDARAVDARKLRWVQALLDAVETAVDHVGALSHVERYVIAAGFYPVDIADFNPLQFPAAAHFQTRFPPGILLTCGMGQLFPGGPFQKALARQAQCVGEPVVVDRLHDVVDGAYVKGLECVARMGGKKNDQRRVLALQSREHLKAIQARHLHVQEDQFRLQSIDDFHRVFAAIGLANHAYIRCSPQAHLYATARQRFIIDDDYADHATPAKACRGTSMVTFQPRCASTEVENR